MRRQENTLSSNWIKFIGTAGARFVMIKQLRSSGGVWLHLNNANVILDPGPGSLVRCNKLRPPLDPTKLDACILTHKHLDHCADINVMIEAMTEGGFKKRGIVFCPQDCLGEEGVIFKYLLNFPQEIKILHEGEMYQIRDLKFKCVGRNQHPVETYGLIFYVENLKIGFTSDTAFFSKLLDWYKGVDILVINVVFFARRKEVQHLCLEDAETLISKLKPKLSILTHFGMTMLKNNPHKICEQLRDKLNLQVISAYDGYLLDLKDFMESNK